MNLQDAEYVKMVGLWIQRMEVASTSMSVRRRSINAHRINFVSTLKVRTNAWNVINRAVVVRAMVQIYAINVLMDSIYAKDSVKVSIH